MRSMINEMVLTGFVRETQNRDQLGVAKSILYQQGLDAERWVIKSIEFRLVAQEIFSIKQGTVSIPVGRTEYKMVLVDRQPGTLY